MTRVCCHLCYCERIRRVEIVLEIVGTKEELKEQEIQEGEVITYQGQTGERD